MEVNSSADAIFPCNLSPSAIYFVEAAVPDKQRLNARHDQSKFAAMFAKYENQLHR